MVVKTIDSRPAGTGDLVAALWIAEGARLRGERILVVDEGRGDIVRAFGHETTSEPSEDCMMVGGDSRVYQEELHTAGGDRSSRPLRWQRTLGWDFGYARPQYLPPHEQAAGWANAMADGRPMVVIAPKANYHSRTTPLQKWLRVAWSLHAEGVRTIAIDGSKEAVEAFPFYAYGFDWNHTMALLSRAAVVAGNDSGIAHLSATIGMPTVVAMGPTDPQIVFGHCLDVLKPITSGTAHCSGCHFSGNRGYQAACDHGCEALQTIPWQDLKEAIMEVVARHRELSAR